MGKKIYIYSLLLVLVSCGENTQSNKAPSFGYHVDRVVRVNEGDINIGTFNAVDVDGDEITYSISNPDMSITQAGLVSFNIIPDFETKSTHTSTIRASNEGGFDEINLTVLINDSICEFDTAAVFDNCTFE